MYVMLRRSIATSLLTCFATATMAADHEIVIANYRFTPPEITIQVGDTITWINQEKRTSHSILFTASGEESDRLFPDERWSRTFQEAGHFEYHCGPHNEMLGTVIVRN